MGKGVLAKKPFSPLTDYFSTPGPAPSPFSQHPGFIKMLHSEAVRQFLPLCCIHLNLLAGATPCGKTEFWGTSASRLHYPNKL